jgi:mycoredoxin
METIKVYGTTWCPDCTRAKQVFVRLNVPYDWINIEGNKEATEYIQKVNGGFKSVPTIVFMDGSVLVEPGNAELERKLKAGIG